jgi:hypothetical protein
MWGDSASRTLRCEAVGPAMQWEASHAVGRESLPRCSARASAAVVLGCSRVIPNGRRRDGVKGSISPLHLVWPGEAQP